MYEETLEKLRRLGHDPSNWSFGGDDNGNDDGGDGYDSSQMPSFAMPQAPDGCTVIHQHSQSHSHAHYCYRDNDGDNGDNCWQPQQQQQQPRQCDACKKMMGGPHLDMFNSLFRQLAEEMMMMQKKARARANAMMKQHGENMMPRKFYMVMPRGASGQAQQQQQKSNKLVIYNEPKNPILSYTGIEDLAEGQMQDDFECPISHEIMKVPIVMSDGHAYEKKNIVDHINKNPTNPTSPLTQKPLDPLIGFYSYNLANSIERWVQCVGGSVYRADNV
jgi:hypothetical protein